MLCTESLPVSHLIRHLWQPLNCFQEKFAAKLGVPFKAVNRWERRHRTFSSVALKLIEDGLKTLDKPEKALLQPYSAEGRSHV